MSDCDVMRESMPLLLTESLDPSRRELAHQHIERCPSCSDEWTGYRETWSVLGDLPEVAPGHDRARALVRPKALRIQPVNAQAEAHPDRQEDQRK